MGRTAGARQLSRNAAEIAQPVGRTSSSPLAQPRSRGGAICSIPCARLPTEEDVVEHVEDLVLRLVHMDRRPARRDANR
jgi:hypothetical protein